MHMKKRKQYVDIGKKEIDELFCQIQLRCTAHPHERIDQICVLPTCMQNRLICVRDEALHKSHKLMSVS